MSHPITLSLKLDRAYELGVIAFVSAKNLLVPIRDRADIQATEAGEIVVHFADCWLPVPPDQIKFCRRGLGGNHAAAH
jgi:hypothetical protein